MTQFLLDIGPSGTLGLVLFFFAAIWCGILVLMGRMSGWHALAMRYRRENQFDGSRWCMQEVPMGRAPLGRGRQIYLWMTVGANADGLYLSVPRFARLGHPNLFIPWSETSSRSSVENWMGYQWRYFDVWFPHVPGAYVRFEKKLARRINDAAFPGISGRQT